MADNVDITPGAGATVATDQVGSGRHYQRMKLTDGAEGSENHASVRADGTQEVTLSDINAALYAILEALTRPINQDPGSGRTRVLLDAITASLTLATITTVSGVTAVTSLNQLNSAPIWDVLGKPLDRNLWYNSVRMRIS
ncbi:MAG TPA: hypothetical protein VFA33_05965 [Bryobacteraceae bacterium]|nr:hypothetical protein [Bryobacteraceae bacterium]